MKLSPRNIVSLLFIFISILASVISLATGNIQLKANLSQLTTLFAGFAGGQTFYNFRQERNKISLLLFILCIVIILLLFLYFHLLTKQFVNYFANILQSN